MIRPLAGLILNYYPPLSGVSFEGTLHRMVINMLVESLAADATAWQIRRGT